MDKNKADRILDATKDHRKRSDEIQIQKTLAMGRRGGARPGAGRPVGKVYPNGRRNTAVISCYVSDEIKAEFERQAAEAGMSQTNYLCAMIERNSVQDAAK